MIKADALSHGARPPRRHPSVADDLPCVLSRILPDVDTQDQ